MGETPRITKQELRALCELVMVSDPWPLPGEHESVVKALLLEESHRHGYGGWVEAYHDLSPDADSDTTPEA